MESQYLQNIRYKLQKRLRRLNGANLEQFLYVLKQFWAFFDSYPILRSVTHELVGKFPEYHTWVDRIFQRQTVTGSTEGESAAIGYGVLRRYAEQDNPHAVYNLVPLHAMKAEEALDHFRAVYLEPLYEYVDEHLDDRSFVLSALIRYKHACEWFRRTHLYNLWREDTRHGEAQLALNLYEYLYEQGIDFQIEPTSASGEADMVSSQTSAEPLIADAKIFNPEAGKGKAYLTQSFEQIYQYTRDYNQPIGYLVIFNTSETQLRFVLQSSAETVPRILFNHKTIFFVDIDIYPHTEPASRRRIHAVLEMTEQDIVGKQADK